MTGIDGATDYDIKRVIISDGSTEGFRHAGYFASMPSRGGSETFCNVIFHSIEVTGGVWTY